MRQSCVAQHLRLSAPALSFQNFVHPRGHALLLPSEVAQVSNLLYRRLPACRRSMLDELPMTKSGLAPYIQAFLLFSLVEGLTDRSLWPKKY